MFQGNRDLPRRIILCTKTRQHNVGRVGTGDPKDVLFPSYVGSIKESSLAKGITNESHEAAVGSGMFDVDVEPDGTRGEPQNVFESRNPNAAPPVAAHNSGIQSPYLLPPHLADIPGAIGGSIHRCIVTHHGNTISRHPEVEFDLVHLKSDRSPKCRQRVLRTDSAQSPMRAEQWYHQHLRSEVGTERDTVAQTSIYVRFGKRVCDEVTDVCCTGDVCRNVDPDRIESIGWIEPMIESPVI